MTNKKLDWYKTILSNGDSVSLEERAKRLHEIEVEYKPVLHDRTKGPPKRAIDYRREAESSYINGNFRSCIFSCACIIDQVFRHEYVKASRGKKKALKDSKRGTFGTAIRLYEKLLKERNLRHNKPFVIKADTLNEIRNGIAVHPGYVDLPLSAAWSLVRRLNRGDIYFLLKLLVKTDPKIKPKERKSMLKKILKSIKLSGYGRYGDPKPWVVSLEKVLNKNFNFEEGFVDPSQVRDSIEKDVLRPLALRSYKLMNEIVRGIYDIQKDVR